MSDQPLTPAVFDEFQRRLDTRFDAIDSRFDRLEQRMETGFDAIARQFDAVARRFDAHDERFDRLEAEMRARFDSVTGQIDAVLHRTLGLEDEVVAIKEGLGRVERAVERAGGQIGTLESAVLRLDERLSRVEKRLDDVVQTQPDYAPRGEFAALRSSVEDLQARIAALERLK